MWLRSRARTPRLQEGKACICVASGIGSGSSYKPCRTLGCDTETVRGDWSNKLLSHRVSCSHTLSKRRRSQMNIIELEEAVYDMYVQDMKISTTRTFSTQNVWHRTAFYSVVTQKFTATMSFVRLRTPQSRENTFNYLPLLVAYDNPVSNWIEWQKGLNKATTILNKNPVVAVQSGVATWAGCTAPLLFSSLPRIRSFRSVWLGEVVIRDVVVYLQRNLLTLSSGQSLSQSGTCRTSLIPGTLRHTTSKIYSSFEIRLLCVVLSSPRGRLLRSRKTLIFGPCSLAIMRYCVTVVRFLAVHRL